MTWVASVPADFPVENYKVTIWKTADKSSITQEKTVTGVEASFTGLSAYTDYVLEVSAKSKSVTVYSSPGRVTFRTDQGGTCLYSFSFLYN